MFRKRFNRILRKNHKIALGVDALAARALFFPPVAFLEKSKPIDVSANLKEELITQLKTACESKKEIKLTTSDHQIICLNVIDFLTKKNLTNKAVEFHTFADGYSPWAVNLELRVDNKSYVVRYIHGTDNQKNNGRSPELEISLARFLSSAKTHPTVLQSDGKKIIIREFIKNDESWRKEIKNDVLDKFAVFLQATHLKTNLEDKESKDLGFTCPLFAIIISDTRKKIILFPKFKVYADVINQIEILEKLTDTLVNNKILCHCDLHPGNYFYDGNKFYLIDLENARLGDGLFDLATLVLFLKLPSEQEEYLLEKYLNHKPNGTEQMRWQVAKALTALYFCLGTLHTIPTNECDKLDPKTPSVEWMTYQGTTTPSELSAYQRLEVSMMIATHGLKLAEQVLEKMSKQANELESSPVSSTPQPRM